MGRVIKVVDQACFYIEMTDADDDWWPTSFGFDIQSEAEGAWLQFWHKNWPELNHHFRRSSCCQATLLQGLKNYIETGAIIRFDEST